MKPWIKRWFDIAAKAFLILVIFYLLMVLYFPSGGGVEPAVRKAMAKNDVVQLSSAIKAYYTDYGMMPSGDTLALLASLRGNNPQKIVFIEFPEKQIDAQGNFLDTWKSPYRIDVSDPKNPKVWSLGKNKIDEHDDPKSDDICSWR